MTSRPAVTVGIPAAPSPPAWPVFLSLGSVALLVAAMLSLDVYFALLESRQTTEIVQNSQRSIVLVNDLQLQVERLPEARGEAAIASVLRAIAEDTHEYTPLSASESEREEWLHLQALLDRLASAVRTRTSTPRGDGLNAEIEKSAARLVSINAMAGTSNLAAIREAHRQAIWSDVLVGAIVLGIVMAISAWLLRVLGRQRRLITERVQFLDEKNRELESFAGRAAHDLRSPMNPIRGYADLILENPSLPAGVKEMAQKIRRAVDRMTRVVDDMLALSMSGRPTTGHCAPNLVIPRVLEEMGPELLGVEVTTRLKGGRAACSDSVLNQLLRNLVANAIKFRSRSRALEITIETTNREGSVDITVEDNGVGMDPESAKRAFEPFYRGQSELELPGYGLGLAIVERTTRALGGGCQLSSALDRGTRVVMRIPAA